MQFNDPSNTPSIGAEPFMLVDGRMVHFTQNSVQDTSGVPAGSTFSAAPAAPATPAGPFIIVDGAVQPYVPTVPANQVSVPGPGSAPLLVHGVVPPAADTAGGTTTRTANAVSWPSVAITAIVAAVVVAFVVMGKSTEAIVTGVVLIALLANHVRSSLAA
ncbi:hypothetical protein ACFYZJ_32280 [Streptomyces sp. NPDC001848]|uniref:hypothetical protein n=1 Tax=Streptomyces sp. NPDC001848 TaxID=3364618 RepID=UPI00369D34BD